MIATVSWRQMHKTIRIYSVWILPVNYKRIMNRPTRWQLASEVDPHGPSKTPCTVQFGVRAAPSGLRFWLTVDHRTNDSSSVCGVCETYYISTRCEPLYPKCNRISSNKNMIRRYIDGSTILLTVSGPVWPRWLKISPSVTTKIMWNETTFR